MFRKTAHNLRSHHRRNFLRGLEPLEPRIVLAGLTIALDYSLDTNNFFADQTRKDTLQRAATVLESRINDDLGTINPTGANTWNATLTHPGTGTSHQINNPVIPVDTLVVYVGARDIGSLGIGGPGGYNASGTQSFLDSISTRGQTGIDDDTPSNTTDFAPWGGHITFDTSATWNFGNDMPVSGQNDFYSVALHEIAHVLGVGTADSWDNQVNGSGQFTGAESVAANGGNIQLNGDQSHWDNDVESTLPNSGAIQEAAMDPNLTVGTRKQFTVLDWASLEDIGWEIGDTFAPTINSVTDVTTPEDSGTQPVALSGISAGGSESQPIQVTATSANPGLIPHPTVSYNSPSSTGLLSYTSNPDQFGVATVTVTVMDGGLDGDLSTLEDNATSSTAFDVVVSEINDKPTINTLPDTVISKNAPLQQTTFTGVTAGPDESQPLLISAVSSNPSLIPNPTVDYTSPATTGTLMYQPTSDETGQTTITLTVTDGGLDGDLGTAPDNETVTISFTVTVEDSNNQPTINNITSQSIDEDSGITNVDLTGISAGDSESQPIQITAVSSNETLIATPTVTYTSPNPSGILSFSPVPDQSGTTTITVTVTDGGADGNLATPADNASVSTIFDVIVAAVNDVPTLDSVDDLALLEDDGVQTVDLTGITAGGGETQILQITASSDNPTLVADPIVDYTSANATGSLSLAPLSDQSGTATITVTLTDAGFDGNLATTEDNQSTTQIFEVVVAAVNDVPTLDSVDDLALLEDDVVQTVDLTGITAGGGETQILQVTASSDNPTLVADPIVDYTSANATGSLSLVPLSDQSGTATITVTVTDAGFDGNLATTEDNQSTTQIFEVVVAAVNDVPTLDSLPDIQIPENASQTDIQLEGISAGGGESQVLAISSTSSNPSLIPNPVVNYTSPNSAGSIQFQPVSNTAGQSIITISVTDAGFDGNLATTEDNQTTNIVFTVTVQESNGSPTIDPIGNTTLPEDSPVQTLSLTGITAGAGESQPLQVTAVSGNDSLIPTPLILYTSAQTTGTLQFTPTANQHGATSITVIVTDGGLDGNLATPQDNASVTTSFDVEVTPLNDSPTINSLDDISLNEDDPTHQVSLTGISAGGDETQTLQISATSSNPALIADPIVTYTSANTTGLLAFTPVAEESGSTTITVTVTDAGFDGNLATAEDNLSTTQTFNVTVAELNDAPTLNPLNDLNLSEDSDLQTVALGGITAGGNEDQPLLVTATSNNHALISDPAVSYTSANTSGSLSFTPTATKSGTTTITVTVTDGGMDGNLSTESDNASSEQSFEVVVTATNDSPTINPISDLTVDENSGSTTLDLTGITAGDGETQPIRVTASSNHPLLIPNPSIDYTSPDSTGTLTFAPGTNKSGFATVTVVVTDGGLDEDLETPADNGTTEESFEIVVTPAFPWHNYDNPLDVNGDHATSPIDVLLIIQELNRNGSYELPTPRSELIPPFYDVNRDGWITPSDALQIINFLNFNNHQVSFGIEFSDTAGSLISTIESGSLFNVSYYAQDLSANPHGVYAAYIDMYYDASLMQIVSGPSFSPPYVNGSSGDTAISGIVDEWGAFAGFDETGGSRLLVSTLQFRAIDAGTALFGSGRADITPLHDVLLFGSNDAVMPELIEFDSKTLFITVPTGEGEEAGEGEAYFPGNSSTGTNMVFPSVDHSQATITSLPDYHFYSLGLGELYSMTHPVESNRPEYSDKITLSDLEEILDLWIGPTDR